MERKIKKRRKLIRQKNKYFNGRKYSLVKYWVRTTFPHTKLAWDMYNYYNPNDKIQSGDGNSIHHKNGDSSDDRIENLEKMTRSEHQSFRCTGINHTNENNPNYKDGRALKENLKEYVNNYRKINHRKKQLFSFSPEHYIEYVDHLIINLKTNHITISYSWRIKKR